MNSGVSNTYTQAATTNPVYQQAQYSAPTNQSQQIPQPQTTVQQTNMMVNHQPQDTKPGEVGSSSIVTPYVVDCSQLTFT